VLNATGSSDQHSQMEPEEYFERVVRFLETKGWNTSTTRLNQAIYVITGTRASDTYYDRMLTMVATDTETQLSAKHMNYLRNAAEENDVDHLMATCRAGLDAEAENVATECNIEFIDPETIDDAFIDEFTIENGSIFGQTDFGRGSLAGRVRKLTAIVGLYLLVAAGFGVSAVTVHLLAESTLVATLVLPGALFVGGPLVSLCVGMLAPVQQHTPFTASLGAAVGYLLAVLVIGFTAAVLGTVGETGLFTPAGNFAATVLLAVPIGALAAGTTLLVRFNLE